MKNFQYSSSLSSTSNYNIKTLIRFSVLTAILGLFMVSCGGGAQDRARMEQLEELKASATANLENVKADIGERVDFIDEEISKADGEIKSGLEEAREDMAEQADLIENEIENIEAATLDNWNDVIEKTSETTAQVRENINEITRDLRELMDL